MNQDKVTDFEELVTKLLDEAQAKGFLIQKTNDYCNFILLSQEHPQSIHGTIAVNRSLEVKVCYKQQMVPPSSYDHIMTSDKVTLLSEITNLLAFTKNLETSKGTMEETFKLKFLQLVNEQLEIAANDQQHRLLKFILEQVNLLFQSKRRRRYSIQLLMMAFIIYATSPRAYERLVEEQVLILPSVKTLKNIPMKLDRTTGLDDS